MPGYRIDQLQNIDDKRYFRADILKSPCLAPKLRSKSIFWIILSFKFLLDNSLY